MVIELMTEIFENLLGKCGNRMISQGNALGMDSYGSVHLRRGPQTHLVCEKQLGTDLGAQKNEKTSKTLKILQISLHLS